MLFFCAVQAGTNFLPSEMQILAQKGVTFVYQNRFNEADKAFKQIAKKWPSHPIGYFFQAANLDAIMVYYGIDEQERPFYEMCDKTIQIGERFVQSNPGDLWAQFFIGGAQGYKGTYEARYKRWISAFRNGLDGVNMLQKISAKDTSLTDAGMGIGMYLYWRSKLMKTLWWMPGVEDKREEGMNILRRTMERGVFTKEGSAQSLTSVLMEEKRYADALIIAERMLALYPQNRVFLMYEAECLFQLKRYKKAEEAYHYLLDTIEADEKDNHYYAIACRLFLGKIYFQQDMNFRCVAECRRLLRYNLDTKTADWTKEQRKEAQALLEKSKVKM
jgi:tetratricopeptide (TPR) repeat protein